MSMSDGSRHQIHSRTRSRVLLSLGPPDGTTKFVVQLSEGKSRDVQYVYFTWRSALFAPFDLLHVHWPEYFLRAGTPLRSLAKKGFFLLFLLRLFATRKPVVRTLHNIAPHESGTKVDEFLLRALDSRVKAYIRLNEHTPAPESARTFTIKHGHYRDWFAPIEPVTGIKGRILTFGLIRPYKGIENLISEFSAHDELDLTLRIVGKPVDRSTSEFVEKAATADKRITTRLEFLPDADLVTEIHQSELVVLPYKAMHNSGTLMLALSLSRPVLVPWNELTQSIADEIGPGWVYFFEDHFSYVSLRAAYSALQPFHTSPPPTFVGRDWDEIGMLHHEVYDYATSTDK